MKPLTQDGGYGNVLLGQGYRTLRGAVMDNVWSDGGMTVRSRKQND